MAGRSGFDYRRVRDFRVARRTVLKSGTGIFVPLYVGVTATVIIVGAGGAGCYSGGGPGGGGGAGAYFRVQMPLCENMSYVVGSGGTGGTNTASPAPSGGSSRFGGFGAGGGAGGREWADKWRVAGGTVAAPSGLGIAIAGGSGGSHQVSTVGYLPGETADPRSVVYYSSSYAHGCGGSSVLGLGGDASGANGHGFGAGGRGGYANYSSASGSGSSGVIIVEEYE